MLIILRTSSLQPGQIVPRHSQLIDKLEQANHFKQLHLVFSSTVIYLEVPHFCLQDENRSSSNIYSGKNNVQNS